MFAVILNIAFLPLFIWVLKLRFTVLAPIIFVLCVVGGYAPTQDMHDVWLMLLFGVVGYLMRKLDYPMAPMVLAIVLGPLAESSLRQSLMISHGSPMVFFERPISGVIMLISALLFLLPVFQAIKARIKGGNQDTAGTLGDNSAGS
jgi:putative tricarboxylic transport membrane protein